MEHHGVRVAAYAVCAAVVDLRVDKLVIGRQRLLWPRDAMRHWIGRARLFTACNVWHPLMTTLTMDE